MSVPNSKDALAAVATEECGAEVKISSSSTELVAKHRVRRQLLMQQFQNDTYKGKAAESPDAPQIEASQTDFAWSVSSSAHNQSSLGDDDDPSIANDDENDSVASSHYSCLAAADSCYERYSMEVDPAQNDRARDLRLLSLARPHMMSFHLAWTSFFVAFFSWFAMSPLLSVIGSTLDIDDKELWTSSVLAVAFAGITRVLAGPLNDMYGPRWTMAAILLATSVPTALAGVLIYDKRSLYWTRLFVGVSGSSFVSCEYWCSSMFTREIAGAANALAAGWGNLGGAVSQVVMGSILFPLFELIYGGNSEKAWRTIFFFPTVLCLIMAWLVLRYGDDTPKGFISRQQRNPRSLSAAQSLRRAAWNRNTWLLFVQYAASLGVELTVTQAAALYFSREFGQSTARAAALASIFGWMNLFARGTGGWASDMANASHGLRGRLWIQVIAYFAEGLLIVLFAISQTFLGSVFAMVAFSIFVQMSEGSTFAIVPYVDLDVTGSVAGWVASGGNVGGVGFALLFRSYNHRDAFLWMGCAAVVSSLLSAMISIPGHTRLLGGHDAAEIVAHRHRAKLPDVVLIQEADGESSVNL